MGITEWEWVYDGQSCMMQNRNRVMRMSKYGMGNERVGMRNWNERVRNGK